MLFAQSDARRDGRFSSDLPPELLAYQTSGARDRSRHASRMVMYRLAGTISCAIASLGPPSEVPASDFDLDGFAIALA